MATCDYCNSGILFGGIKQGGQRFCNNKCYQNGFLLSASKQVPDAIVSQQIDQLHQGQCPKCQGRGPVDVHTSYQVFSLLILTRWSSKPQISCRPCGVKSQIGSALTSLLFGWWGFPWGLIFTPVQVTRNIIGIVSAPNTMRPSLMLEKFVRLHIAEKLVAQNQAMPSAGPLPQRSAFFSAAIFRREGVSLRGDFKKHFLFFERLFIIPT